MLEAGDSLRTWALEKLPREWHAAHARTVESFPQCPALADGNEVAADQLSDHRRDYLEYEGELSGDRGRVMRVAAGSYASIEESPTCWHVSLTENGATRQFRLSCVIAGASRWKLTGS